LPAGYRDNEKLFDRGPGDEAYWRVVNSRKGVSPVTDSENKVMTGLIYNDLGVANIGHLIQGKSVRCVKNK
jgi:hypothetical protein